MKASPDAYVISEELEDDAAAIDGDIYRIPTAMLDEARRAINSIHSRALDIADDEKRVRANNELLSVIDPTKFPLRTPKYRKGAIVQRLGAKPSAGNAITKADADAVMHKAHTSVRKVVEYRPKELLKFKNEIELVTLEILHLAFGYARRV